MSAILSQQDLDELYSRVIKDGGEETPGPHPPMQFDSPQSEENFRRLIFGDYEPNKSDEVLP